jgi:photosystem II stability/assembly factor-like uncharacterized protein
MKIRRAVTWVLPLASPILIAFLIGNVIHPATFAQHPIFRLQLSAADSEALPQSAAGKSKEGAVTTADAYWQNQRTFPASDVPPDGYPKGIQTVNHMLGMRAPVRWQQLGPLFAPAASSENPVTGQRTSASGVDIALAVVPSSCSGGVCNTMYLGTGSGGLWKTIDAGKTWQPLLDHAQSLAVGSIALDPKNPDIVYVGTGEPSHSIDSHRGIGILRSMNGGKTWTTLGYKQFVNRAVASVIIDPRTAGGANATIYAVSIRAIAGGATTGGGDAYKTPYLPPLGFYRSKDGGKTWKLTQIGQDGAQSLVMDPSDPNVLYAGWVADLTNPNSRTSGDARFGSAGIFKSTDDGTSWINLTKGLPTKNFGRSTVAIAPSNPKILYAGIELLPPDSPYASPASPNGQLGLYKSVDSGDSWTQLQNVPNSCNGQCWWDMPVAVDPTNPDVVYVGGSANYEYFGANKPQCANFYPLPSECDATVMKSTDGGATWADIGENGSAGPLHPDDHVILISPNNPNVLYTGNDGGIFHSADGGKSWDSLNQGLGTLQMQSLSVAKDGTLYAGTQDNGTFKYTGSTTWKHIADGDGGPTAPDPNNLNTVYTSAYGPLLFRNDKASNGDPKDEVLIGAFLGDYFVQGLGQFYEPYAVAPSRPQTIFYGTYRIWRSNMRGGTDGNHDGVAFDDSSDKSDWVPISFDLHCNSQPADPTATCPSAERHDKGIASIAVSPVNPNVVAVAVTNGRIWITTNALAPVQTNVSCNPLTNLLGIALCDYVSGPTWHHIDTGLPGRYPTSLRFAPGSSTKLYVTYSGFNKSTRSHPGHVFLSDNQGRSWKRLDGSGKQTSLPDLPINDVAINSRNGHLYVGGDYGVFVSADGGRTWRRIDQTMPQAQVYEMTYYAGGNSLIVATHGRGVWRVSAP